MDQIALDGRLETESQYASPARGRGRLLMSDSGVEWEIRKLLGGRRDRASWAQMHTFSREGPSLLIAWSIYDGERPLMSLCQFKGTMKDALQAVRVAHLHLSESNWRADWADGTTAGARLDEVWAREWEPL